jgi:hypothetical protein
MELSLAGIIGAAIGTMVSAAIYVPLAAALERRLRRRSVQPHEHAISETELALLRRAVIAADMLVCAGIGYWVGFKIGG